MFKPRQMVRLRREARGDEPLDPVRKPAGGHAYRTESEGGDPDPLLKDLAAALPLNFGSDPVEETTDGETGRVSAGLRRSVARIYGKL